MAASMVTGPGSHTAAAGFPRVVNVVHVWIGSLDVVVIGWLTST